MKSKGLTLTLVFEAESANYGEGIGNITALKKMSRGDSNVYTYISRQALRYNIVNQASWDNTPVDAKSGVVQFDPLATIKDYPEIDLFGFMKTTSGKEEKGGASTRNAVVRLSNAISLEPYNSELDFLTNMGLAKRGNFDNAIAQSEIHKSYYSYTIAIDLEKVGVDKEIEIDSKEKANRINTLLDTIEYLYRDIKGRRENLSPIFAIGGLYDRKTPYFEGRVTLTKNKLNTEKLLEVVNSCDDTKNNTKIGYIKNTFANDEEINNLQGLTTIGNMFSILKAEVEQYYEGN